MAFRRFSFVIAFGILFLGVAAFWSMRSPFVTKNLPRETLVIGIANIIHAAPVLIAEEKGFFRDERLDLVVRNFPNGKPALDAQLRGELDVATVAETPVVISSFSRKDFVILASFLKARSEGKLVVHPDSKIESVNDLRGKRVGVLVGTTAHFFLHVLLTDHGLTPKDVIEVPMSITDLIPAMTSRRVDAVAVFEPFAHQVRAAMQATAKEFDSGGRSSIHMLYTVSRDFPARHPNAARSLLVATSKAIVWMHAHRNEAIAIVASKTAVDPQVIDALWDNFRSVLSIDHALLMSLDEQARWALRNELVPQGKAPNYLDYIDTSTLRSVKPEVVISNY